MKGVEFRVRGSFRIDLGLGAVLRIYLGLGLVLELDSEKDIVHFSQSVTSSSLPTARGEASHY